MEVVNVVNPKKTFIGEDVIIDTNYPEDIIIEEGVTLTTKCIIVTHFVETVMNVGTIPKEK